MKSKIKYITISVLVCCAILIATSFIFRKKIATRYIPKIEQVGVIHIKLNNDTSYINLRLEVTNKSFLKIEIDTVTYEITLFNKRYLQRHHFLGLDLPAYGKDTLEISLKIPYGAILKDLAKVRKMGDSTSYSVQLYLQYSTFLGKSEVSINKAVKLKIPQVPQFEIEDIKWNKVHLKSILADVTLKLTNHSNITLNIKDLKCVMKFLDQGHLKGNHKEPIIIKPNGETLVTISIEIVPDHIIKTAFEVLADNDNYDYTLLLNATLEPVDSPKENFHIELIKSGKMELKKHRTKR